MEASNLSVLWQQFRRTKEDALKSQLVLSYLWMVKHLAGRLALRLPPGLGQEDLESCGVFGLMEAVDKYDPEMGRDFEAFAYLRVRGAMLDEIRKANWVPRTMWQKMQELKSVRERLERELDGRVTEDILAREMGLPVTELRRLEGHYMRAFAVSLDEIVPTGDGDSIRLGDSVQDPGSPDPLEHLSQQDSRRVLAEAVKTLSEKEQILLALYYQEELTLKEIGKVLDVSESRVCQLHSRAITRLRKKLDQMNNS